MDRRRAARSLSAPSAHRAKADPRPNDGCVGGRRTGSPQSELFGLGVGAGVVPGASPNHLAKTSIS